MFLCNCPDSLIRSTICKHVHLLQRVLQAENGEVLTNTCTTSPISDDKMAYVNDELKVLSNYMPQTLERNDITSVRERVQEKLLALGTVVQGCHCKDSLLQLDKQLLAAKSLLDSTQKRKPLSLLMPKGNMPANKKIEPQLRFFSTKKKRKHTSQIRFTKPTDQDIDKLFRAKKDMGVNNIMNMKGK